MELQYSVRASPSAMEEEEVLEREKEATKRRGSKALLPPLYIGGPRGGAGPRRSNLLGGAAKGEESFLPKAPRRCLPLLGLFLLETLGAWASWGWCPWPM